MGVLDSNNRLFRLGCALLVFLGLVFNNGLFWDITSRRPASVHWTYRGQGKTAADGPRTEPLIENQLKGSGTEDSCAGAKKDGAVPGRRTAPQTADGRLGPAGTVNN